LFRERYRKEDHLGQVGGTTAVARVTYTRLVDKRVTAAVVAAGGTGYVVADTITLANGVVLTVATLTGDAVATVTITNAGRVNGADPTNPQAQVETSGDGTGATFTLTWGADAGASGAYQAGDIIANCQTAAAVLPVVFPLPAKYANCGVVSGRIHTARLTLVAASGTIVLPKFDLLLFRPTTLSLPADNGALSVPMAAYKELIAVVPFSETAFRNAAGALTAAGTYGWQSVAVGGVRFDNAGTATPDKLIGVMQAQNAWAPTALVYEFNFSLDLDLD
jgi:hypothetical protein